VPLQQQQQPQSNPAAGASLSSTAAACTAGRNLHTLDNSAIQHILNHSSVPQFTSKLVILDKALTDRCRRATHKRAQPHVPADQQLMQYITSHLITDQYSIINTTKNQFHLDPASSQST